MRLPVRRVVSQREGDDHERGTRGVDRQVGHLPPFDGGGARARTEEARIEVRRPRYVDEQEEVLPGCRDAVRGESESGDARLDRAERERVHEERTRAQDELEDIERTRQPPQVSRRGVVEEETDHDDEEEVEGDQHLALHLDRSAHPRHRSKGCEERRREERRERPGQHRRDVLDHPLPLSDKPRSHEYCSGRPARDQPLHGEALAVDPDRGEDQEVEPTRGGPRRPSR